MKTAAALLLVGFMPACRTPADGPYSPPREEERSTHLAEQLNREAAHLIHGNPERAEQLLRESLTADLFFGPAHNNLGVVFLNAGKLYEAAQEFEWAKKLLPGDPDPRLNLGLVLERAGHNGEAMEIYETALDVRPGHLPAIQARLSLALRTGHDYERLEEDLAVVALRGESPDWRDWARLQLARVSP